MTTPETVTLEGRLERITFRNPDNHYTVARLRVNGTDSAITVVGHMTETGIGESLRITGSWANHPRFGQQFVLQTYEVTLPDTVDGIREYLMSGIIKGIGPRTVRRIVNKFGENTLEVIENTPGKLKTIPGIGKKLTRKIVENWHAHHTDRILMQLLQKNGLPAAYSAKLIQIYGEDAARIIEYEPYRLAADFPADGFHLADRIAKNRGIPPDDPVRIRAGTIYILMTASGRGHTFLHVSSLEKQLSALLALPLESPPPLEKMLEDNDELIWEKDPDGGGHAGIYLKSMWSAEQGIAAKLHALLSVPIPFSTIEADTIPEQILQKLAISLTDEQQEALSGLLKHPVCILTGGPGTGKTTLIRSICTVYEGLGKVTALAAPTGRAAKRLSEVTDRPAATLHRLLAYNPAEEVFDVNQDNPVEADVVIVDEASMVDTQLMYRLCLAVSFGTHLIFVGDVFQLPSVGPGNVLSDLIDSKKIKTFRLTEIFRQARQSPIILNAHKVRRGERPIFDDIKESADLSEFYFIPRETEISVLETVVALVTEKIPKAFGFHSKNEIQVITPMHKGLPGTINLNQRLQEVLNPSPGQTDPKAGRFRSGDKVMHLKNNYTKEVFNGDIGMVKEVEPSQSRLFVDYDGRIVEYDFAELEELTLAYAISVHKSQGSEYPAVVAPLVTAHYPLLQRNLLYTAITRGKQLVVLTGSRRAFDIALQNDKQNERLTGLKHRLVGQNRLTDVRRISDSSL